MIATIVKDLRSIEPLKRYRPREYKMYDYNNIRYLQWELPKNHNLKSGVDYIKVRGESYLCLDAFNKLMMKEMTLKKFITMCFNPVGRVRQEDEQVGPVGQANGPANDQENGRASPTNTQHFDRFHQIINELKTELEEFKNTTLRLEKDLIAERAENEILSRKIQDLTAELVEEQNKSNNYLKIAQKLTRGKNKTNEALEIYEDDLEPDKKQREHIFNEGLQQLASIKKKRPFVATESVKLPYETIHILRSAYDFGMGTEGALYKWSLTKQAEKQFIENSFVFLNNIEPGENNPPGELIHYASAEWSKDKIQAVSIIVNSIDLIPEQLIQRLL